MGEKVEAIRKRRFIEYCAEVGRISQSALAERSDVSQMTISRIVRGLPVASQSRAAALIGLNAIRKDRCPYLDDLDLDDVLWSWE